MLIFNSSCAFCIMSMSTPPHFSPLPSFYILIWDVMPQCLLKSSVPPWGYYEISQIHTCICCCIWGYLSQLYFLSFPETPACPGTKMKEVLQISLNAVLTQPILSMLSVLDFFLEHPKYCSKFRQECIFFFVSQFSSILTYFHINDVHCKHVMRACRAQCLWWITGTTAQTTASLFSLSVNTDVWHYYKQAHISKMQEKPKNVF